MHKIVKYVLLDILRNKVLLAYTIFLMALSICVFNLEDNSSKGLLSLLNVVLIIVPLVSITFCTIYVYNSSEFLELLVSQPIKRTNLWLGLFAGLSISMLLTFLFGIGIPILVYSSGATGIILLLTGSILSVIFVSLAMFSAVFAKDKAKGIGLAIIFWLYFSLLFDGLVLFILFQFQDYPLERFMIAISAMNPIDLCRIMVLLKMDISALMGYTGAVFKESFGSGYGMMIGSCILMAWAIIPFMISLQKFKRKDI